MARTYGISEIEVIPHGVTIPREVTESEGKTVLAIGKMNARKGMETLLEAIPLVLKEAPKTRFQIVGTAEDHPKVREFREKHRVAAEQVDFLGMVNEERLHDLYNGCAVYVSPATYESFGLTFAEAMAHGRPVVGCNASAVPEIVRDGLDGLLVPAKSVEPLAQAITRLVEDVEMRTRMGAAARKRAVESYSLEVAAERVERFFEGVVRG
jgi:glycosyltransferase involved in cell wall biosynthesis